ncbi:alpha/beta fold hydrolase [Streptomyces sp. PSKA30]|uniref:alpha/beta fold hydrolase n=1 Tax=Streptomyces sp. PSKA30 TaxID=2874597 RepID=UPI001CD06145|nr:alpha/beta hydrolase [Streptomyces sp. PSKA30]MBZ9641674.1 alpha/beta hydrolase [Streptomyces sp. PSKA30]
MPIARVNGIDLSYDDYAPDGPGEPVVMVAGTGAPGRIWRTHQVPALKGAEFRVITLDNRGIPPTGPSPGGFSVDDMAADVAGLIEYLGAGPCRVVGHSLGGLIAQELVLARPELVTRAVLMAGCGRADALITAMSAADIELADSGVKTPPAAAAYRHALQNLSPRTLNDEEQLRDWLAIFELSAPEPSTIRAQLGLEVIPNRLPHYRRITRPCLVVGFQDDLVVRPHLSRELAQAIPGAMYTEIPGCGHYGYLERPDAVNEALIGFLTG